MKKSSKTVLLFVIIGLVFAGIALAWYFSRKAEEAKTNVESEYYYSIPEPGRGSNPRHIKGG